MRLLNGEIMAKPKTKKGKQRKVKRVLTEFKEGELRSGKKGPKVTSKKQAVAIALSEAGLSKKRKKRAKK